MEELVKRAKNNDEEAFDEIINDVDILFLNIDKDVKTIYQIESVDSIIKYFWDQGVKSIVIKLTYSFLK